MNNEKISGLLGVDNNTITVYQEGVKAEYQNPQVINDDYEYLKDNLRHLIDKGRIAFSDLEKIAYQGGSFKEYDALAKVMTAVASAAKTLAEINIKKQEILISDKAAEEEKHRQTNVLVVGSTKELQEMLKSMKEKEVKFERG